MAYVAKLSNAGGAKSLTRYIGVLAGNPTFIPGAYESISTAALTGTASTITFSSVPNDYRHLQIRIFGITGATFSQIQFNSDTGTNYSFHQINSNAPSVAAAGGASLNQIYLNQFSNNTAHPGVAIVDILDYANTNKNTTVRSLSGVMGDTGGLLYLRSGVWVNTAAVNTITITAQAGTGTFAANTNVALYGIRGAA